MQCDTVAALKRQSPARKAAGATTRFLHVSGIDPSALSSDSSRVALRAVFEAFGPLEEEVEGLSIIAEKRFCWVRYKETASAEAATAALSGRPCDAVGGLCLHLSYAEASCPPPAPAPAVPPQEPSGVPGLEVLPDFISAEEEEMLLGGLCAPDSPRWEQGISRRVQHYGYTFAYETLTLRDSAPRFTAECAALAGRLDSFRRGRLSEAAEPEPEPDYFTQVTVNEYLPGQGISSHIDNVECFGDSIYILSIGAGITMVMTENNDPSRSGGRDIKDSRLAGNAPREASVVPSGAAEEPRLQRHVWLPPRSLLVLEGDARFRWCHGIAPRKNDQLPDAGMLRRGRRVSLTFRQATAVDTAEVPSGANEAQAQTESPSADDREAAKQARKAEARRNIERKQERKRLAAAERALQRGPGPAAQHGPSAKVPSSLPLPAGAVADTESDTQVPVGLEQTHVFDVYDQIALHWHHTRGIRKVYWQRVKEFLDGLPRGTLIADVGSGDGKYFGVNPGVVSVGCDRSEELLRVSWTTEFETLCCDAVKLPYRDSAFDAAICIAVMHHLATVSRRLSLLREMMRIVTVGGFVVVQAWAQEQGEQSKRTFDSQDVLVPWQLQTTFAPAVKAGAADSVKPEAGQEDVLRNTTPGNNTARIFQRYCHVYKEGELEGLCAQIPGTELVETGWDKGNWFVKLRKVLDHSNDASC